MIQLVLTTFPDAEQAKKAAHHLVKTRLAACGTLLPTATSVYIWKETLEESQECLLLLKTTVDCVKNLHAELLKIHPYEVPEIVSFAAENCHPGYAKWVAGQCKISVK